MDVQDCKGNKGDAGADGTTPVFFAAQYQATAGTTKTADLTLDNEIFNSAANSIVSSSGGARLVAPYTGSYRFTFKIPAACIGPETAKVDVKTPAGSVYFALAGFLEVVEGEVFVDLTAGEEISATHVDFDPGPGSTLLLELLRQQTAP